MTRNTTTDGRNKNQKGFTAVEMVAVLFIFGLITTTVLYAFGLYNKQKIAADTDTAMSAIKGALYEYKGLYGVYPCPAALDLGPNDPNYGREQRMPGGQPVLTRACGGTHANPGGPDMDHDNNPDQIAIGAVPFATLLDPDGNPSTNDGIQYAPLSEALTRDGWGWKIVYAVTENLTNQLKYNDFSGAIDVVDENKQTILSRGEDVNGNGKLDKGSVGPGGVIVPSEDVNGNGFIDGSRLAHLVLISKGEDGLGAYTRNGTLVKDCPNSFPAAIAPAVATPESELENCNPYDGVFLSGLRNDLDHSYNDDRVDILISQGSSLWTFVGAGSTQIANTNPGNVGIGTDTPTERLAVVGDINASSARAAAFSDTTGTYNVPPQTLGGDGLNNANMQCPTGQVVKMISQNSVICEPLFPTPITSKGCPTTPIKMTLKAISNTRGLACCDRTVASGGTSCSCDPALTTGSNACTVWVSVTGVVPPNDDPNPPPPPPPDPDLNPVVVGGKPPVVKTPPVTSGGPPGDNN